MIKFSNARSIGTFIFLGLSILVLGLIYLSAQDLFAERKYYVSYFNQNVKGLVEGAPVAFRGVNIGKVTEVSLVLGDIKPGDKPTPLRPRVVFEVFPDKVRRTDLEREPMDISEDALIKKGMRATLQLESFLTGKLYLSLDYYPDDKPRFLASRFEDKKEIPSLDRSLQGVIDKISGLPFDELVDTAISTLDAVQALAGNPDLLQAFTNAKTLLADADKTVNHLDSLLQNDAKQLIGHIDAAMLQADALLQNDLRQVLQRLKSTLTSTQGAMDQAKGTLQPSSPLQRQLLKTLDDFSDAARSLEALTDYLEQHPESILRGKTE